MELTLFLALKTRSLEYALQSFFVQRTQSSLLQIYNSSLQGIYGTTGSPNNYLAKP